MTMLYTWAARWGVSQEALLDLQARMGLTQAESYSPAAVEGGEAATQVKVRLDAAKAGIMLWRNNVGALQDARGVWVRYGLCNDSMALNEKVKSADLIGIKPVTIEPHMIGWRIGQFVSREVKKPGWTYTGTGREPAQLRWAELVTGAGGDASFVS
jgi:hypothetical protein